MSDGGGRLARAWSRWVARIDRREPGTALALFRILTGLSLLLAVGSVLASDLVTVLWVDGGHGGYRPLKGNWLVQSLGGATPGVIGWLVALAMAGGVLLTVGILARPSALVAGQALIALSTLNVHGRSSYDPLLINSLWLLVLADSTATHSLRCRLRSDGWTSDALVTAWPRYLVVLQLAVLYTFTGLHKISIHWTPAGGFSALYYILQQPSWQRGDMTWLASVYPLTQLGTAVTWLFELSWPVVPLALWWRSTADRGGRLRRLFNRLPIRAVYVAVGLVMHLSIFALMEVGPFSWVTLAYYPCLFRASELANGWARLTGRLRRRASA
ncbi:MAG: hypothetical protein AAF799_35505 [Myxococcota bacterium]